MTTNDRTPTIAGSSDVAPGTIVGVAVDTQTLTAVVQPGGIWNVTPAALTDGSRTVIASVTDPAGNPGTASQTLTVDTVAPALTITGGSAALTNDATPAISGTAAVPSGTAVTVDLADETLSATVDGGGTWSVIAAALADGPHRIVVTVSDPAGNGARSTQTLTVDTVAPVVAIDGGATATTSDPDPTIVGISDAATGTIVTVVVAGQTMTALLQANGTWNATPAQLGEGAWTVVASVRDPAGNVGSAGQVLTIAAALPGPGDTGSTGTGSTGSAGTGAGASGTGSTGSTGTGPTGPATTPTPVAAIDAVTGTAVRGGATQRIRGSSRPLSIATTVTAPAAGRVVVTVTGTVKIKGVRKALGLTRLARAVAADHRATLKLRLAGSRKAAAAAIKRITSAVGSRTRVIAKITVKIVDAAGHIRTVNRHVKLT